MKTFNKKLGLIAAGVLVAGGAMAEGNLSTVAQNGATNSSTTTQSGNYDTANTTQSGTTLNIAYMYQTGNNNAATTTQSDAADDKAYTIQDGNYNAATTTQYSDTQFVETIQNGYGNHADNFQYASYGGTNAEASTYQSDRNGVYTGSNRTDTVQTTATNTNTVIQQVNYVSAW
jgi:hypothetical protein